MTNRTTPRSQSRFPPGGSACRSCPSCWGPAGTPARKSSTAERFPNDYRQRHPIAIEEANRSVVIFVGQARGGLSASQRADVMRDWRRPGSAKAPARSSPTCRSTRRMRGQRRHSAGNPGDAGGRRRAAARRHCRRYRPDDPRTMATIRLSYPKISAVAGPCGLWPEDLGPSVKNKELLRKQTVLQFRLRLSAQHGGDGRQSGRPRAAAI